MIQDIQLKDGTTAKIDTTTQVYDARLDKIRPKGRNPMAEIDALAKLINDQRQRLVAVEAQLAKLLGIPKTM